MVVFQFSNILKGLGPGLDLAWAWPWPGPGPRPSKILENWKNTIKIGNYWKLLEIIGKLKVFQYFLTKILETLMFSSGFSTQAGLGRPKPGQGLVQKLFPYPSEPFCDDVFSIPAEPWNGC